MIDETDLPAEVALLWGLRTASRRGPKPSLTVDDITRAAVELADEEGLAAVSMARVAAKLGNATMALYRHVKSKDELLLLMSDAAPGDPPALPADADWRAALESWGRGIAAAYQQHPWLGQIPVSGPPIGPRSLAWFDRALGALSDTGLTEDNKVAIVLGLMTFVRGGIRFHHELSAGYVENPDGFSRQYGTALARLVDPRKLPALTKVVEAGVFDTDTLFEEDDDPEFEFGLNVYLDGIAAFIRGHGGSPCPK